MITNISNYLIANPGIFLVVILWEVCWKGFGLWRAGRKDQPIWFVLIFLLNTMGILPIIYLLISKKSKEKNSKRKK